LRFLETRFGVEVPHLSDWRRAAVGDMTSAFNFSRPDFAMPLLPPIGPMDFVEHPECITEEATMAAGPPDTSSGPPPQEHGSRPNPSGVC